MKLSSRAMLILTALAALSASTVDAFGLAGPKKLIKSILVTPRKVLTDQVRGRFWVGWICILQFVLVAFNSPYYHV